MNLYTIIGGIVAILASIWWTLRKARLGRERAEGEAAEAKAEAEAAEVKAEVAIGDASVARAEASVIVEAMAHIPEGNAAEAEVTRAASEAEDHPDRAAARAGASARELPSADDTTPLGRPPSGGRPPA